VIALATDCILLKRSNGEFEPMDSHTISIEVVTEGQSPFDEEFVKEASAAVLHYFKKEEGRDSVTLGEFAAALEKVLMGFSPSLTKEVVKPTGSIVEADMLAMISGSGEILELNFFPKLRQELRNQLRSAPQFLRFYGLRNCVLRLAGSRRWTHRCRRMEEQIVGFLRECLAVETSVPCALVVE
jgi:hypothetical protein